MVQGKRSTGLLVALFQQIRRILMGVIKLVSWAYHPVEQDF